MKIVSVLFFVFAFQNVFGQLKTYSFEEVDTLTVKKPIIVFLHTNWCKFCRAMENTTFKNENVIKELNKNYYFISFNAETKEPVTFQNAIFNYKPYGKKTGVHQLAEALGTYKHKVVYPTTVVLNIKNEIVIQYPSMLRPKGFLRLLRDLRKHEKI